MAQSAYRNNKPAGRRRAPCRVFSVMIMALALLTPVDVLAEGSREGDTYYVSLLSLLTAPEHLDGSVVRVMGFLKYDGQLRLYMTRDHAEIGDRQTSLVVVDTTEDASLTESSCTLKYVSVVGEFRRFPDSSFGLINIREVSDRASLEKCWPANGLPQGRKE